MAKKFKNNFQDIFTPTTETPEASSNHKDETNKVIRTTLLMDSNIYEQIKAIAFFERRQIKDVINEAFLLKVKSYPEEELNSVMDVYLRCNK